MEDLSKNVVIAYWASSQLAFIEIIRRLCNEKKLNFYFVQISHEENWFTDRRSFLSNFLHLSKIFFNILCLGLRGRVASFGTNTCRILFFFSWLFRDIHYVYNELPSISPYSPLTWLDWFIFRFAKNISVSSLERAGLVSQAYKLNKSIGVLENITFIEIPQMTQCKRFEKVIFSGSVTRKRFSENDIEKVAYIANNIAKPIDVYGDVVEDIFPGFIPYLSFKGKVDHSIMLEIMQDYKYGVLSYYTDDLNYDFCAPLKLYEYLACGCRVISLNKNNGLIALSERYPALISFVSSDVNDNKYFDQNLVEFINQRESFLSNAISSNWQFARCIVS